VSGDEGSAASRVWPASPPPPPRGGRAARTRVERLLDGGRRHGLLAVDGHDGERIREAEHIALGERVGGDDWWVGSSGGGEREAQVVTKRARASRSAQRRERRRRRWSQQAGSPRSRPSPRTSGEGGGERERTGNTDLAPAVRVRCGCSARHGCTSRSGRGREGERRGGATTTMRRWAEVGARGCAKAELGRGRSAGSCGSGGRAGLASSRALGAGCEVVQEEEVPLARSHHRRLLAAVAKNGSPSGAAPP